MVDDLVEMHALQAIVKKGCYRIRELGKGKKNSSQRIRLMLI